MEQVRIEKTPDNVQHFPELDGVRGLAILMVLFAHGVDFLGIVPHPGQVGYETWGKITLRVLLQGWGGVDLFFALSGFLITGILLRARRRRRYFTSFYARRVLRIFPIYYLSLIVTLLAAHFFIRFGEHLPSGAHYIVPYFLYLQNWPCFWTSWAGMTSFWGVYWSLAVEEQFYMVWPTLIRFFNLRVMLGLCIVGFLAGWPVRIFLIHRYGLLLGTMQSPFSRMDGLFVGAAIALYRELYGRAVPMRWAKISMFAGLVIFVWLAIAYPGEFEGTGRHLWPAAVTAFALLAGGLIAASHYRRPLLHKFLTTRPLLLMGKLSYGMYVYHLVIYFAMASFYRHILEGRLHLGQSIPLAIVFLALTICLTTAIAMFSFRYIETPFLKLKRFFPSPAAPV
jgi:peptidoglycan/LPS O-acetylase OafA/YrhL